MSHLIRSCAVLVFLAVVVAGGYAWQQAENAAAERAEWVSAPIEGEDDTVGISLSASGLLNQDVVVSAYVLGEEDRSTEDFWLEDLARGDPAEDYYLRGFRRVVTYDSNRLSRTIIEPPAQF